MNNPSHADRIEALEVRVQNLYENLNPLLPGGAREPALKGEQRRRWWQRSGKGTDHGRA